MEQFQSGQLIAKMLYNPFADKGASSLSGYCQMERIKRELDELKYCSTISTSSATLLIPNAPVKLFRDVGLLISAEKVTIRRVYSDDVVAQRVDPYGRLCKWYDDTHEFRAFSNSDKEYYFTRTETTVYRGDIYFEHEVYGQQFDTIKSLRDWTVREVAANRKIPPYNEVIINYPTESIVGLVASSDIFQQQGELDQQVKPVFEGIKRLTKKYLDLDPPFFLYDPSLGALKPF